MQSYKEIVPSSVTAIELRQDNVIEVISFLDKLDYFDFKIELVKRRDKTTTYVLKFIKANDLELISLKVNFGDYVIYRGKGFVESASPIVFFEKYEKV